MFTNLSDIQKQISDIEQQIAQLPVGHIVYKTIKGKKQPYLQWNEGGKTISKYLKKTDRDEIIAQVAKRKELTMQLKLLRASAEAPGTYRLSEAPGPYSLSEAPGTYRLSEAPGTYRLSEAPGPYRLSEAPGPYSLSEAPGPYRLSEAPGTYRLSEAPGTYSLSEAPGATPLYRVSEFISNAGLYRTNVSSGRALQTMIRNVSGFKKRDCFCTLQKFLNSGTPGRICLLYGLRRTGKSTLLFQAAAELSDPDKAVYIKARVTDTMADFNHDLKILFEQGFRYVFIDEVTLVSDFINSAALFSDVFAMMNMKIVLSGTDSLGFWLAQGDELYDRAVTIHTTFIPFREYVRLLGIQSIDDYIRFGGTLRRGETAFDDPDALQQDAAFRDDESTRRYIDSAICKNIQHSLLCYGHGEHFANLKTLYDANELTGAINRIIESMNHQFVLKVLTEDFVSHDLGSAAEVLRKDPRPKHRSDALDYIDREPITAKLMEILEIRNAENRRIGLTESHVREIKEYLKALELIVDAPREKIPHGGAPAEYVIFTQPGMRYCQAEALVYALMQDDAFGALALSEKAVICDRILEEVRGRMMEDIVLLETMKRLPRSSKAFKLLLLRGEYDMVIYDAKTFSCRLYEIKHSDKIVSRQYAALIDPERSAQAERLYGPITERAVIYRGPSRQLDCGIKYINVEEYLQTDV